MENQRENYGERYRGNEWKKSVKEVGEGRNKNKRGKRERYERDREIIGKRYPKGQVEVERRTRKSKKNRYEQMRLETEEFKQRKIGSGQNRGKKLWKLRKKKQFIELRKLFAP